jgi:ABC-type dipeptide/oligopeptide/nickel transport system ATPase subunit
MLPTNTLQLNKRQLEMITSNESLLCLGRSGTGKTTTSVLRMFVQEILYRKLLKMKERNGKNWAKGRVQLTSDDIAKHNEVKFVFVTASPVLTNEVRRYYQHQKESLINHLKAREINRAKV